MTLGVLVAVGLAAVTAPLVLAAARTDTGDKFSLAKGTVVSMSLQSGTKLTLSATVAGAPVTATCWGFTASGTIPSSGLAFTISPPKFSGCTDSAHGTDKFTSKGTFTLTEVDVANDEAAEKPGDIIKMTLPAHGVTITTTAAPGCTLTLAPSAPASMSGAFNDKTTILDKNASMPFSTSAACPGGASTGTGTVSGTIVLSKSVHDVS